MEGGITKGTPQTTKPQMSFYAVRIGMTSCTNVRLSCLFLETLFFIACMIPAYGKCWDENIIPKWYASICVILMGLLFSQTACHKKKLAILEWKSVLPYSAGIGILFQACFVINESLSSPTPILEYGVGGTYGNPSGLAVSICLLYPLTLGLSANMQSPIFGKHFSPRIWNVLFSLISLFLIISTNSRTGIIVFASFMIILFYKYIRNKTVCGKIVVMAIVIVIPLCLVFLYKTKSTEGRSFILMRTADLISKKPLEGYGFGNFEKTYMTYQGEFFERHPDSKYAQYADTIRHPLNEFAKLWVEYGIIGPLLLAVIIIIPFLAFKDNFLIIMLELCLFLFCMFSYPLSYPLSSLILIGLPFVGVVNIIKSVRVIKTITITIIIATTVWLSEAFYIDNLISSATFYSVRHKHNRALLKYSQLKHMFSSPLINSIYLSRYKVYSYNYARELFTTSNYIEALNVLSKTDVLVTNYDIQLLRADIKYNMKDYISAITAYKIAYNMCPVRFAPLEGLLNCYHNQNNIQLEKEIAYVIINKEIKVNSNDVNRIRYRAAQIINTNNN